MWVPIARPRLETATTLNVGNGPSSSWFGAVQVTVAAVLPVGGPTAPSTASRRSVAATSAPSLALTRTPTGSCWPGLTFALGGSKTTSRQAALSYQLSSAFSSASPGRVADRDVGPHVELGRHLEVALGVAVELAAARAARLDLALRVEAAQLGAGVEPVRRVVGAHRRGRDVGDELAVLERLRAHLAVAAGDVVERRHAAVAADVADQVRLDLERRADERLHVRGLRLERDGHVEPKVPRTVPCASGQVSHDDALLERLGHRALAELGADLVGEPARSRRSPPASRRPGR